MLVGSAAASYLVEKICPEGFASRDQILERIQTGERTKADNLTLKCRQRVHII